MNPILLIIIIMGFLLGMYCIFLCLFLLYAMVLDKIEARKYARYTK